MLKKQPGKSTTLTGHEILKEPWAQKIASRSLDEIITT